MTGNSKQPETKREERLTEDEIARASLGGVKGSRKLPPAPMTKKEAEQISPNDDPGHVA
jgi:hypothetical protein